MARGLTLWVVETTKRLYQLRLLRWTFGLLRANGLCVDGTQAGGSSYFSFPLIGEGCEGRSG